jgi:hypothetical protein
MPGSKSHHRRRHHHRSHVKGYTKMVHGRRVRVHGYSRK